uniref:Uncharacterized protein n=1 Tax=viral metagenome TaxID=1070528 RepID=A0A6C0CFH2_9ZZZZ
MGSSQSTPQQQQYYQPPERNNYLKTKQTTNSVKSDKKDSEMMKNIKSKNLFYYIVALKDKENKIIEGYDLMIAVDNNHEIQNTQVLSIDDYNKIAGSDDFKNKFNKLNKKIKTGGRRNGMRRRGGTINNIQQCPPCALQQPQQQIQYQKDTTFGQSFTSSFGAGLGAGLGVMSTVLLMDLLLPRFNYYGYGYYDTYGYDNDVFIEVNNYYPDNYDEGYEDGYEDATDNQENSGDNLDSSNIDNTDNGADDGGDDYGDGGDFSGGRRRRKNQKNKRIPRKSKS